MAIDRTVRSLTSLNGASSSRVLNLLAIGLAQAENEGHRKAPLFESPVINNSIILKHRLRADEIDMFPVRRVLATKVIIPFERKDLRVGGQSLFVGQQGFEALLREVGNYADDSGMKRDLDVLRMIDSVPSLDPFLLREHLRGNDINPDSTYFEISTADQQRMHDYAAVEISRLTAMASGKVGGAHSASTGRMVSALLSSEVNEKLEPLRATLNLNPEEFCEGVFSWRGFIYYKWSLGEFWPNLIRALKDLKAIRPTGKVNSEQIAFLNASKEAIIRGARDNSNAVRKVIDVYDNAYASLIERQDPRTFREFLLSAPTLFLEIGEKMGAMSHVTSFWQYRFPPGAPKTADADELTTIFQDFTRSFGLDALVNA
ncbi:MAG TPA: hypothetical protein VNW15_06470 [Rhizomicrobium sp.]|nr:hypothetical protein [Rhizomicrobium sp.]